MSDTELMVRETGELSVDDVRAQVNKIQALMADLMSQGEHYGVIPGTKKPTLYKAGAEKLGFTFRLVPEFSLTRNDLADGHREYEVVCTLRHQNNGTLVGQGVGNCSTMESKYRYRNIWTNGTKVKVENTDIADVYNTVLKMAKKRAYVDAMITACAASDIFTQDVEDTPPPAASKDNGNGKGSQNRNKTSARSKILQEIASFIMEHDFPEAEKAFYREEIKKAGQDEKKLRGVLEEVKKAHAYRPPDTMDDPGLDAAFEGRIVNTPPEEEAETTDQDDLDIF